MSISADWRRRKRIHADDMIGEVEVEKKRGSLSFGRAMLGSQANMRDVTY